MSVVEAAVPATLSSSIPTSVPDLSLRRNSMGRFLRSAEFVERMDLDEGGRSAGSGSAGSAGGTDAEGREEGTSAGICGSSASDPTEAFEVVADPTRLMSTLIVSVLATSSLSSSWASRAEA